MDRSPAVELACESLAALISRTRNSEHRSPKRSQTSSRTACELGRAKSGVGHTDASITSLPLYGSSPVAAASSPSKRQLGGSRLVSLAVSPTPAAGTHVGLSVDYISPQFLEDYETRPPARATGRSSTPGTTRQRRSSDRPSPRRQTHRATEPVHEQLTTRATPQPDNAPLHLGSTPVDAEAFGIVSILIIGSSGAGPVQASQFRRPAS